MATPVSVAHADRPADREFTFTEEDFRYLSALVHRTVGIDLAEGKRDLLYGRLARRLRTLGLSSFTDYRTRLEGPTGADEINDLVNHVTTNHTAFFRERHHFEHFEKAVLEPWAKEGGSRLRVWSAACSTGEEPYSIALTVARSLPAAARESADVRILATDIDTRVLETAQQARFPQATRNQVPEAFKSLVETPAADHWTVKPAIRDLLVFKRLNLLENWPMRGPFDVIFCRNVMIYFDMETKIKLVQRFAQLLRPSGLLYIGHSERLTDELSEFSLEGRTIYRKKA